MCDFTRFGGAGKTRSPSAEEFALPFGIDSGKFADGGTRALPSLEATTAFRRVRIAGDWSDSARAKEAYVH